MRPKSSKSAKFEASDRQWTPSRRAFDPSLETKYGAHLQSLITSAIQMIFKVPLIRIIMRIISENDDRTTRFACVRPSTVSVMKKVLIASMAERLRPSAHQLATQALQMVHPCAIPRWLVPNTSHSAHQRALTRRIARGCDHSPALGLMRRTPFAPH